jgi:hypothetical protein
MIRKDNSGNGIFSLIKKEGRVMKYVNVNVNVVVFLSCVCVFVCLCVCV